MMLNKLMIRSLVVLALLVLALLVSTEVRAALSNNPYCQAQMNLKKLGLYQGGVTCRNDEGTRKAIEQFQKINGLIPSGIMDPTTTQHFQLEANRVGVKDSSVPQPETDYSPGDEIRPEAQPVTALGAKQVNDAKLATPVVQGVEATAANNYGTDGLRSRWETRIPVWLMVVLGLGFGGAIVLVIMFLRGSKKRNYFE